LRGKLIYLVLMMAVAGPITATAKDVCSDASMTAEIQPYATEARNAVGICPTAKAMIKLMKKSIAMIDRCKHMSDLMVLRADYVQQLKAAQQQANGSCS